MLIETIRLIVVLLVVLVLGGGTLFLVICARRRRPVRRRTSPLAWAFLLLILIPGACDMGSDLVKMTAMNKVTQANSNAKYVYLAAADYLEKADGQETVTVIAQFSETDTSLKAALHKAMVQEGHYQGSDWYAVVCRDGAVELTLFSGHELTHADLHEPDFESERRRVMAPWTTFRDAVGYYTKEKRPSDETGEAFA